MDGFVKIPRALFELEAWRNASEGQKVFILELYARVAFAKHKAKSNGIEVEVDEGEYVMSQRKFAEEIGMGHHKIRGCQAYFEKYGIISSRKVTAQQNELCRAQSNIRATILRINNIGCAQSDACGTAKGNDKGTYTEEGLNRENITPYNPPKFDSDDGILSYDQKRDVIKQHVLTCEGMWIENFCMKKHIGKEQFEDSFDEFIQHRIDPGQVDENYEKVKILFANWYVDSDADADELLKNFIMGG